MTDALDPDTSESLVLGRDIVLSVDRDYVDGGMRIRLWRPSSAETWRSINVPFTEIESLVRDVVNTGLYALRDASVAYQMGDCTTCRNTRLVEVERNGRPLRVHCPACAADGVPRGFDNVPTFMRADT